MHTRKRFGQHFLESAWAEKVVAAIRPLASDRFLEIGPGPGALTFRLAPCVAHLTAIEVDRDIVGALRPRLPGNVDLVEGDVLKVDLVPFASEGPVRVAGNLPYNISSPILFRLIEAASRGRLEGKTVVDATLMLQREVAARLEALAGTSDYGVLSILVQRHAEVHRILTLPPGAFRPAPKVHSAVVQLTFRPPLEDVGDEAAFTEMVRSMFTQRRKTLANALAAFATSRDRDASEVLRSASIDPGRRPETLDVPELARLARRFATGERE